MNVTLNREKSKNENAVSTEIREKRLDSLRGIAALLVALGHSITAYSTKPYHFQTISTLDYNNSYAVIVRLLHLIFNADSAVIIFFVLSGHVLTSSLNKIEGRNYLIELIGYLIKRAYRILPVVIFSFLVSVYFVNYESVKLLKNMLLLDTSLNGVTWTLQVEVIGSIFVFLTFYLKRVFKFGSIISFILALTLFFSNLQPVYIAKYIIAFWLGCEVSDFRNWLIPRIKGKSNVIALGAISIMLLANFIIGYKIDTSILVQIISATIIVLLINSASALNFMEGRFLNYLGKISYSFYLFHQTGGRFTKILCNKVGIPLGKMPSLENILVYAILSVTVALIISSFSYYFIEKPSIMAGSGLSKSVKSNLLKLMGNISFHNKIEG